MNCKYCNGEYRVGCGTFCSRACCNKARGPRSEQTKAKIAQSVKEHHLSGSRNYSTLKAVNADPIKRLKAKNTWVSKRDYNVAHFSSIGRWIREEIDSCEVCGLNTWRDLPLPLEVHHVDGNKKNNLRENLQVLCPNCHALTPNWRGRKTML